MGFGGEGASDSVRRLARHEWRDIIRNCTEAAVAGGVRGVPQASSCVLGGERRCPAIRSESIVCVSLSLACWLQLNALGEVSRCMGVRANCVPAGGDASANGRARKILRSAQDDGFDIRAAAIANRGGVGMNALWKNLRYGMRVLAKSP